MSSFDSPINEIDNVINNIIRDVNNYNGTLRYYDPDGKSSYDIIIAKNNNVKINEKIMKKKYEIIFKELDHNINNSSETTDRKQLSKWKDEYSQAYEYISYCSEKIEKLNEIIHKLSWNRYLEIYRNNKLWNLRCNYILNGDMNLLQQGVEQLYNYLNSQEKY